MYGNEFTKGGVSLSTADFARAEAQMGKSLPEGLKEFLLSVNGGVPERTYWPIDGGEFLWVKRFLSLIDSLGRGPTIEQSYLNGQQRAFLPSDLIPFAIDHGGNFFCLDEAGRVYFYAVDAWSPDATFEANVQHAKSYLTVEIRAFIEGLEPDEA
ncbi:SMI1/KNR4 family protein [Burkholderia sp. Bp9004]|uniref:SMI1/KNR4 family protein n=1 Tax=Burkholderia sp. Bp9004 TaxID=2184559 RepID=UPI0021AB349B|nr:SMI1/KNR4 family protein [Burkholderia sp. Bp9004]